ncbi:hypothetical protein [Streptomyces sp. NPDC015131]|uniref:hypothetical protein n=1 Tax=Streptomyces sp. NPDC015131 TaxID=3364941 RepID=UPI0036FD87C9
MTAKAPDDRPGDGSSVPDEEWARFLRDAGESTGTEPGRKAAPPPREASADERAARARRITRPAEPAGWRTGPAWRERDGRATRRRRVAAVLGILAAAGLLVVAVRPQLVTDRFGWERPVPAVALPADRAPEDLPTPEEPFRGSPAAGWADGAAGIALPEARATGGLSREQVARALADTRRLLIAANLDPATLRGDRPRAALALLDPRQEDGRRALEKALTAPGPEQNPLWVFSRFDPSEVRPAGDVVKVLGTVTYEKGDQDGEVLVHTDHTFVYPVVKAEPDAREVARTVVRRQMTFAAYDPEKVRSTPGTLHVLRMDESAGNDDCTRDPDGFLHPQFLTDLATGEDEGGGTGPAVDPYDMSEPLDEQSQECGTVTRT